MSPVIASALVAAGICFADEPIAPPADVDTILEKWAAATPVDAKIEVDFTRFIYDHVFRTEKLNAGTYRYDPPSNCRVQILRAQIDRDRVSTRRDKETGNVYQLETDSPETWELTADAMRQIRPELDAIEEISLSDIRDRAKSSAWTRVYATFADYRFLQPMVMSGDIARLKSDFEVRVSNANDSTIDLVLTPISEFWKTQVKEFQVRLDPVTYRATAARQVMKSFDEEKVYVFRNWKIEHAAGETTQVEPRP